MKIATIFAAGALAAGTALMPAAAEARTYVSIGVGSPGYYGGYSGNSGYYGSPYYDGYYGRRHYRDRGYSRHYRDGGYNRHYRERRVVCRYDRYGRERCRRVRW